MRAIKALSVVVVFLAIFLAAGLFIPAECLVPRSSDEIDYYGDATRLKLRRYEITGLPYEIRSWLEEPHDGAFGTVIAIDIISWGLSHPDDFVFILEGIDTDKREHIVSWLGSMVEEIGKSDDFLDTFDRYESIGIAGLKAEVGSKRRYKSGSRP